MEKEIEVGEYGRTNTGKIFIFVWVQNEKYILVRTRNEKHSNDILNFDKYYLDKDEEIVKRSKNIIDLIEVGDYVNGHLVVDIIGDEDRTEIGIESDHIIYHYVDDEKIKSIVTKEQFAQAEYKIKEDK